MIVDSSALVAILLGEPEADQLAAALASASEARISAPNWLEAMMVVSARLGEEGREALVELLDICHVGVEAADADLAQEALSAWLRFGKGRHPAALNFGDCFAYALSRRAQQPLLFKGDDFPRTDIESALTT